MRNFVNTTIETPEVNFAAALKDLYESMKWEFGIYTELEPSHIIYTKRYDRRKKLDSFIGREYTTDGYLTREFISFCEPTGLSDVAATTEYFYDTTGEKPELSLEVHKDKEGVMYYNSFFKNKTTLMYFRRKNELVLDQIVTINGNEKTIRITNSYIKDRIFSINFTKDARQFMETDRYHDLEHELSLLSRFSSKEYGNNQGTVIVFNHPTESSVSVGTIEIVEDTEETSVYRLKNLYNPANPEEKTIVIDNRINDYMSISSTFINRNGERETEEMVREKEVTKNDDGSTDIKLVIHEVYGTLRCAYYTLDADGRLVYSDSHKPDDEECYYEYERFDF